MMDPQDKKVYEEMGKNPGLKLPPEDWARRALPTAFVCKRDGKEKAIQSQKNAISRVKTVIESWERMKAIESEWAPNSKGPGTRKVYWREQGL